MISACAEDRCLFQILKPASAERLADEPESSVTSLCMARSVRTETLANQILENVTERLQESRLKADEIPPSLGTLSAMKKIYAISKILDHIPYTLLYVSSGWMASKKDTETSLEHLTRRLQCDPQKSRRTLTYAAQVFRRVRNQRWLEAFDPLYLLLTTLYIWYYGRAFDSSTSPNSSMWPPVKVDDEALDETIRTQWVSTGDNRRPHIAGIGFLYGGNNGYRVLKEAVRILYNGQGWQPFAHAVGRSLQQVLSGFAPSFKDA